MTSTGVGSQICMCVEKVHELTYSVSLLTSGDSWKRKRRTPSNTNQNLLCQKEVNFAILRKKCLSVFTLEANAGRCMQNSGIEAFISKDWSYITKADLAKILHKCRQNVGGGGQLPALLCDIWHRWMTVFITRPHCMKSLRND